MNIILKWHNIDKENLMSAATPYRILRKLALDGNKTADQTLQVVDGVVDSILSELKTNLANKSINMYERGLDESPHIVLNINDVFKAIEKSRKSIMR